MATPATTITFTLTDTAGNPVLGKVVFTLTNTGLNIPRIAGTGILAPLVYTVNANASGFGSVTLYNSSQIVPAGTYYSVSIYKSQTQSGADSVASYQFAAGTFDLSNLAPISSNPVVPPPQPLTAVVTNPTGTQTVNTYPLNLAGGLPVPRPITGTGHTGTLRPLATALSAPQARAGHGTHTR